LKSHIIRNSLELKPSLRGRKPVTSQVIEKQEYKECYNNLRRIRTHTHTHTYTHIHTHTHIHIETYTHLRIHTHTYTYKHTHTYTHTHTHAYIYIYTIIIPTKCTCFLLLKSQDITICNFFLYFCPYVFQPAWVIFSGLNASAWLKLLLITIY
jgi:hypothetical protein